MKTDDPKKQNMWSSATLVQHNAFFYSIYMRCHISVYLKSFKYRQPAMAYHTTNSAQFK